MTDAVREGKSLPAAKAKGIHRRVVVYLLVIAAAALLVAIGPYVLDRYTQNILVRSFLYAVAVLSVDVLWGYTGILTFGQSAFFGIGAYAAGLMFTHVGFGPGEALAALVLGIAVALAVAWLAGWISFWHRATPLYVAVITLVLPIIVVQLLYSGGKVTGSSSGLVGFMFFFWSVAQWFWIAGGLTIAFTAVTWLFVNSDFGAVLRAIRENEDRCRYLGIDATRIKISLLMAGAAVAAIAGYFYAGFTVVVAPEIAGFVFGTELVIYTALGGRGTLLGPVIGTIVIDLSSAYLSGNLPFVWKLIIGSIFVAVIVVLPQGIAPIIAKGCRFVVARVASIRPAASITVASSASPASVTMAEPSRAQPGAATGALPLRTKGLCRSYGSLNVLSDIDLEAHGSEIVSIVGPNGAGKKTLMRCISNGFEPTSGQVWINDVEVGRAPPPKVVALGVGRSFQNTSLFGSLTVIECLRLARHRIDKPAMFSRRDDLALPEAAFRILTATGLDGALGTEVVHLSHGQKRALELAMVLATEPSVLLLDEPTAGLTKTERRVIGDILQDLARRDGLCILLIEHDLDFVRDISSRIVVLHQGQLLMAGSVEEVVNSDLVRAIYSGGVADPLSEKS